MSAGWVTSTECETPPTSVARRQGVQPLVGDDPQGGGVVVHKAFAVDHAAGEIAVSRDAGLALMMREFVARQGSEVRVTAGAPIPFDRLASLDDAGITAAARAATFGLRDAPSVL